MAETASPASPSVDLNALRVRALKIRRHIIEMLHESKSGHPGGSLSAVELVTALYFGGYLRYDVNDPDSPDRDRFILSKGHGVPVQYAAMAEAGFFDVSELMTLRKIDSRLQGHPVKGSMPGIEASTGSLGLGLSIGLGMASAADMDKKDFRTWVLLGDGECQEGQVWEAAMAAGADKPSKLIAIVDNNRFQLDGPVDSIITLTPFAAKWESFNWLVKEIDGHDIGAVCDAYEWAISQTVPVCIIAHTVKGKGVSFMENQNSYHGVAPTDEEMAKALGEFEVKEAALQQISKNGETK
jgi:transketolase